MCKMGNKTNPVKLLRGQFTVAVLINYKQCLCRGHGGTALAGKQRSSWCAVRQGCVNPAVVFPPSQLAKVEGLIPGLKKELTKTSE